MGTNTQHTDAHTVLHCGHAPTPDSAPGTGYAISPIGVTRCYACSDAFARASLDMASDTRTPFHAYLSTRAADGRLVVSTWTGGELAEVISTRTIALTRTSFTHGATIQSFTARDARGRLWYGRGNAGIATTIRRKGK